MMIVLWIVMTLATVAFFAKLTSMGLIYREKYDILNPFVQCVFSVIWPISLPLVLCAFIHNYLVNRWSK
jgi:hypothetical protein